MIRVGGEVSTPADFASGDGSKYGVWEPVSEKFLATVVYAITNAVVSSFVIFFFGGPIYALVVFYFALRLIGIETKPCCAKDGKKDLKRTCRFLVCFFPLGC